MTYQASMAYPAAAGAQWPGHSSDAYQQYYAAYGYGTGYDMSSYYQQQYAAVASAPGVQSDVEATGGQAAQPATQQAGATSASTVEASSKPKDAQPESRQGDAPPPPPPPPPPLPPGEADTAKPEENASAAQPVSTEAASTAAAAGYDSAAYSQWYAQTYGAYYGYQGYDPNAYAYWQQQQQYPGAYAYASQANVQEQHPSYVPVQESQKPESSGSAAAKPPEPFSAANGYHTQPPPSGLYTQHSGHRPGQDRHRLGGTGPNTVPIGQRQLPSAPTSTSGADGQQQVSSGFVIRPQLPGLKRATAASAPAYIAVGSASATASTSRPQPAASNGQNSAVAAAVAAGAASAAAAAAAAKAAQPSAAAAAGSGKPGNSSQQWPPNFTAWVTRCFNAARLRSVPDSRVSEKLMAYLDHVKAEGKLWTTDWDTQPVLLPDSPSEQHGPGDSVAGGQVLSLGKAQGGRRSRWGAVPEQNTGATPATTPEQGQRQYAFLRQPHSNSHRKRSHVFDSDDEDPSGGEHDYDRKGRGGASGSAQHPHHHQHNQKNMGKNKRKKSLEMDQQFHVGRRGLSRGAGGGGAGAGLTLEELRRRARAGRFGDGRAAGAAPGSPSGGTDDSSGMDMSDDEELAVGRFGGIVVGTCQALEKSYFRLTSQPDPSTVRPEPVLERALERLVSLIARGEATYFYSLDQFKGMRQDCTVQHLRNSLAVRVYEAHARSSLEYGDTAEFNQCQARLGHLYAEGQPGCVAEFTAYRLLYETVHCVSAGGRGGDMAKALLHTMRNLSKDLMASFAVRHALQVREAIMTNNYAAFFRLYATAPNMGRGIMDSIAEAMRWGGLNAFVKACDLPIPVSDVALLLGFSPRQSQTQEGGDGAAETLLPGCMRAHLAGEAAAAVDADEGTADCAAWLRDHGAVVTEKGIELLLDCKSSRGKLFVPEVTAKVAHGDENLSVVDFLSAAQRLAE